MELGEDTRARIAAFLPDAIMQALIRYQHFARLPANEKGGKDFAAHQNACKAAVAHIELLLKFAKQSGLPDAKVADHNSQILLSTLIQEAVEEVEKHNENELY